jgi:outer membrane lipoprotein-sorting protein
MILTNLIGKCLVIFFAIAVGFGIPIEAHSQENPFSELRKTFEQGTIFNADFSHQSVDSYTQDTVANSGQIWVGQRQYKVKTRDQSVVVDGETSKVYDEGRNRVIISKYEPEEDDFAPSRILNGVDSTFTVQKEQVRENDIHILLHSDDPFAIYKQVEIFLSKNLIPQKIIAVDPADNVITTSFSNGEFAEPGQAMFQLDIPDDAEIVDMRN